MKHLLTILLFTLAINLSAQQAFPIGATWHYTAPTWPEISYHKIVSEKDTIILSKICRKLINLQGESEQMDRDYPTQFVYHEDQKVYIYIPSQDRFGMLYDFEVKVDSVGVIQMNDSLRKIQYVDDNGAGHFKGAIIEGIGHTEYFFPIPGLADPPSGPFRCYEDSVLGFFQYDHTIQGIIPCDTIWEERIDNIDEDLQASVRLYPNPIQDQFTIQIDDGNLHISAVQLMDIKGRILKKIITPSTQRAITVDVQSFATGIYLLEVELYSGQRIMKKLLKK